MPTPRIRQRVPEAVAERVKVLEALLAGGRRAEDPIRPSLRNEASSAAPATYCRPTGV